MLFITLAALAFSALIWYIKSCHDFFKNNNVPHEKPVFLFGNILRALMGKVNMLELSTEIYWKFKDYKYVGMYRFLTPSLIINDPELVGQILVQDFQHFCDNDLYADETVDFIMAKNVFALKGHKWRTIKNLLTPMFTSVKLKSVYPLMEEVGERFGEYISKEIDAGRGDCIEGKPLCVKLTTENVASSVFGLHGKAFVAPGEKESEFVKVARDFGDPSYINSMKFLLVFMVPALQKILKIKFFSKHTEEYMSGVIMETLKYRRENNIVRNDFLDMISALKEKSTEYKFDDHDIVAQSVGFFLDGVETSACTLSYVFYELAANPEVQQKLREEILEIRKKNGGRVPYDECNNLEYLDCIINETLRKNPPAMALFKVCTKDYQLPPAKEDGSKGFIVKVGQSIQVPVEGFHQNPDYFPEPEKFKPERFLSENKNDQVKHTFLAFGQGPRACLGMRFGLLQLKMAVITVLSKFKIENHEKTEDPLEIHPMSFIRAPKNGFWFRFKKL